VRFHSLLAGLTLLAANALTGLDSARFAPACVQSVSPTHSLDNAPSLVTNYCAGCHQAGRARIDLDGPTDRRAVRRDRPVWTKVLGALRNGVMPPTIAAQLSAADRQLLIRWLEGQFAALEADRVCRLVVRRLRRSEYTNTIRDLFGINWQPPDAFPDDDDAWDLAVQLPTLPAALREQYEAAAQRAVALANLGARLAVADAGAAERSHMLLASLARRAYRGPVPADEAARLHSIVDRALSAGASESDALRAALRDVLTSSHFLFVIEQRADADNPSERTLTNEHELAARLAAFLWQSVPDETLLQLADEGRLRPALAEQLQRMLRDPRAATFARDFAGGWLGLDQLVHKAKVAADLRQAMRQETEHFVGYIVEQDRSVLEFLDANYAFVNERLATHYGIAGIRGSAMQRVSLTGTFATSRAARGGLLTQGSFLALTSFEGLPSPVQRGKWILTNLLGTPPPAPPAGLLDGFGQLPGATGPASVRESLARHREHTSCAHCHAQIDGLGLALEEFDGQGAWRPHDESLPPEAIVLPDGDTLHGVDGLKSYLLERRMQFFRALGGKLLGNALGRKLRQHDQAALEHVAEQVLPQPRFGNLLLEVVQSAPFQMRAWEP
jgi:hypothetical protein